MALSALTRVCTLCHVPLPDPPAPAVCGRCGYVAGPHHVDWAPVVKWWLLSELQVDSFHAWRTEQDVWEYKLRTALNGVSLTKPNPWGLPISTTTSAANLYPLALERANWWKASGSPIARRVLAAPARSA